MLFAFSILILLTAIILYKLFVINYIKNEQKQEIKEAQKRREADRVLSEAPTWHRQTFYKKIGPVISKN
jgi:cell division protein FtsI/penicillin-binding protein 2